MKMSPPRQTGLLGAVRPQTPHRSPWQAFGGNFQHGLPAASSGKTNTPKLFSLHDYMPPSAAQFSTMSLAISVQNVSKRYRLGEISRVQLLGDIHRWWMKRWGHKSDSRNHAAVTEPEEKGDFWALKDISFDLEQGETIAIVGANGAGKSTLLKIISRITAPTTGLVRIRGRIGTLLEVGTGFHPELTGRDNVFLNGAILGMSRGEVKRKFDDIVGFAGLEQFIDTPVKRYSSGMYVRLAFSVAAFLEPEILIVDEVLSVGDQQFQSQCTQRMEQIIKDGRTLIFVSHGAAQVQQVCRRAIFLQHGRMIFDGAVDDALAAYADSIKPPADQPQHSAAETAPPGEVPLDSGQAGTPQIASEVQHRTAPNRPVTDSGIRTCPDHVIEILAGRLLSARRRFCKIERHSDPRFHRPASRRASGHADLPSSKWSLLS